MLYIMALLKENVESDGYHDYPFFRFYLTIHKVVKIKLYKFRRCYFADDLEG